VRGLFEDTVLPVRDIAAIAGVSERTIYRYARKNGWRLRYPGRVVGGRKRRGQPRPPRSGPPQPRGAGGRYVTSAEAGGPHASGLKVLDPQGAARAMAACEAAGAEAQAAFARALAERDAQTQTRVHVLLLHILRDLADIATDVRKSAKKRSRTETAGPKPRRPRYQWKPLRVTE